MATPKLRLVSTVAEGDADADGIEIPANALSLGSRGIVTTGGERICQVGHASPGCDGLLDLPHSSLGPFTLHKMDAQPLWVSVADTGSVTEGNAASFPVRQLAGPSVSIQPAPPADFHYYGASLVRDFDSECPETNSVSSLPKSAPPDSVWAAPVLQKVTFAPLLEDIGILQLP